MSDIKIGEFPARYIFLLNPHTSERCSKCPTCRKLTHPRKFALQIVVKGCMPYVQGKTCRYCSRCEIIICDQLELEGEMTRAFLQINPDAIGREYLVVGTCSLATFKQGLKAPLGFGDAVEVLAMFKAHYKLNISPGGWGLPNAKPRIITHAQAVSTLSTPWKNR